MALTAIHPGEHLAEELEALNMSAAALARQLKVPTNRITEISTGSALSPATRLCALPTSSAPARSSGSISRASTSCA
jgi:plasmid maintenance system antidote protein VapI